MIDPARIRDEFLDLASIPSLSRREGAIARRLEGILKSMGASVEVDGAGEKLGGETGNLLARFTGNREGAPPFLLSAHMDTVAPAAKIRLVVEGDIVRTDRTSVLGGDDKAGIVAILGGLSGHFFVPPRAARPASMGGAFIGVANDATAAAINPAGLSFLLRPEISLSQALGWQKRQFPVGSFAETEGTQSQANLIFDQTLVNIVYPQWGFTFALFRQVIFRSESDFSRSQFLTIAPPRRLSLHEQLGASGNFPGISSQFSSEVVHNAFAISRALHRKHRFGFSFRSTQLNLQLHEKHYFDPELWLRSSFANGSVTIGSNHPQSLYRLYEVQENELKPSWSLGVLSELQPNLTLGIVYQKLPAYDLETKIFLPAYTLPDTMPGDAHNDEIRFAAEEKVVRFTLDLADNLGVGLAWKPNSKTLIAADAVYYFNRSLLQGITMNLPQDDKLQKDGSYADPDDLADLEARNILTLHAGLEYAFGERQILLPVRFGFYTEPNFGLQTIAGDANLQQEYPGASTYLHVTAGFGIVFKQIRFEGSVDASENLIEAIGSALVRF